jgi:hypothetical protein
MVNTAPVVGGLPNSSDTSLGAYTASTSLLPLVSMKCRDFCDSHEDLEFEEEPIDGNVNCEYLERISRQVLTPPRTVTDHHKEGGESTVDFEKMRILKHFF